MVLSSILEHMRPQWIVNYHEHDSLLEHIFDEELSEEERKAAWESYNAQKSAETARYICMYNNNLASTMCLWIVCTF